MNVGQASRFVSAQDLKAVKAGIKDGTMDIVVGTHALLGKGIEFKDLGLLIVDEEQHFGVAHKERLKALKAVLPEGTPLWPVGGVAADSLGARRIGAISWEVSQRHVHDALLLPDDAIRAAQLWLWKELKLAVEPAAALGLAALQTGAYKPQPQETVALILCGANFDPASLA